MSSFRIRPRFKHIVQLTEVELKLLFQEKAPGNQPPFKLFVVNNHLTIRVPIPERHFWSPQLALTVEKHEKGTLIRGLYGPNPSIWAAFFFAYASLGLLATLALLVGLSQTMLGMNAIWFWGVPACGVLALALYLVAQTGQKIGAQQMYDLHHFYESTIGKRVEIK